MKGREKQITITMSVSEAQVLRDFIERKQAFKSRFPHFSAALTTEDEVKLGAIKIRLDSRLRDIANETPSKVEPWPSR